MWKSKKFIIISIVVAVVVLVGASVGVVFAADNPPAQTQPAPVKDELTSRVAQILGIDQAKLESAFNQARKELAAQRLDTYLKKLVTDGKLTQQQADQYKQWIQSRPNIDLPGGPGGFIKRPPMPR